MRYYTTEELIQEAEANRSNLNPTEGGKDTDEHLSFPIKLMPPILQSVATECHNIYGVEHDLSIAIALGTLSAALGKGILVNIPPWKTSANTYIAVFARSGSGKSTTYRWITHPLQEIEQEAIRHHNEGTAPRLRADKSMLEAERKRLLRNPGENIESLRRLEERLAKLERQLIGPRIIVEDCTPQRLAIHLSQQNEQLASMSSEAGEAVDVITGRWRGDSKTDENLLLKTYSLENFRQDRVSRDAVVLQQPCLSLLWLGTPDMADRILSSERFLIGGLLPRFLVCESASKAQLDDGVNRELDPACAEAWKEIIRHCYDNYRTRQEPYALQLSIEAEEVLREFHNHGLLLAEAQPELDGLVSRKREQAVRIAIALHVASQNTPASSQKIQEVGVDSDTISEMLENGFIQAETAEAACRLVDYFQRPLSMSICKRNKLRDEDLRKKINSQLESQNYVSLRDLKRSNKGLSSERIHDFVDQNATEYVIEVQKPATGRPSEVIRRPENPKVIQ